jgi:hypothetical protein
MSEDERAQTRRQERPGTDYNNTPENTDGNA